MQEARERWPIGSFAAAAGVSVETVRYYQRRGLLPEPDRLEGRIRRYGEGDAQRVRFVKSAQRLGFSLDQVAELLALEDGTHCTEARQLAEHKLVDVRSKLGDLRRIERVLSALVQECRTHRGTVSCPLIGALRSRR